MSMQTRFTRPERHDRDDGAPGLGELGGAGLGTGEGLALLRGLAELREAVALLDGEGTVLWVSDALAAHCGDASGLKGRSWLELLAHPRAASSLAERLCADGRLDREPVELRTRDGRELPARVSALPVGDDAQPATLALLRVDEAARPSSEELERRIEELRALLDCSPDGVVVVDAERCITYANRAAAELMGPSAERAVAERERLEHFVADGETLERIGDALREGRTVRNEDVEIRRCDGSTLHAALSAGLLRVGDGRVLGAVAYLRDVTEQRHFQESLAHTNAELEHYVDAVSHDLRSPLVSLLGFSRLLREDYGDRLDEKGRHFLERIDQAGRTMEGLIHDLLELSRIGRCQVEKGLVDPKPVLEQVAAELKPRLDETGTRLELPSDAPLLTCNRTRLYQIFSNLIGNALDHMGKVSAPRVRVQLRSHEQVDEVVVEDNGRGIPPEQQERIFQIFKSLGTRRDGGRGTGIGLAIVKRIAETHGGDVHVESEPGHGAAFRLLLPRG